MTMARLVLLLLIACSGAGCQFTRYASLEPGGPPAVVLDEAPSRNLSAACVANFDPTVDYFPQKSTFHYSRQLHVEYHRHYKVVSFRPTVHTQETFRFALVQCGAPAPTGFAPEETVTVPAQRFLLNVPGYGDTVVRLGVIEQLAGVAYLTSFITPEIVARGDAGLIREVGNRSHSNLEPAIALDPDLVFLFYSAYPNANLHPQLAALGVQGVPLADHFEPHPLGRSEWVKFFAMFFNREAEAESIFAPAAARYEQLRDTASTVPTRPDVLLGSPSGRDVWTLMGGRNFVATLVWHAGGRYFWTDEEAGSLVSADFERVMDQSLDARAWLGGFARIPDRQRLISSDARLAFFTPVQSGGVHASDVGIDPRGATPYASGSLDKPDVVLADIISSLHPELLPTHQPVFYRRLN